MINEEMAAAVISDLAALGISSANEEEIRRFLFEHPEMSALTKNICKDARDSFGPGIEIILSLYQDPEIDDRHLLLNVRYEGELAHFLSVTDHLYGKHIKALRRASGWILINRDLTDD